MSRPTDLYEEIVRLRAAGVPAALCTVLLTRGSTPGKETMKMLVRQDGSTLGTVGGGCVEEDVRRMALEVIHSDRPETRSFSLNQRDLPESGLICGGQVTILAEPVTPPILVLFGGGHVAGAAARVAKECELRVHVCDDRAEYAEPRQHPAADECFAGSWEEAVRRVAPAGHHYLVVATRGHKDDAAVLKAIHDGGCRPKYLGLIGSRAKKATLDRILLDEGVAPEFLASIKTPIGLDIGARSHGEIAVALVAELVRLRRTGALQAAPERPARPERRHQAPV
ncbi:MAG: XdhC family protein [Planctomycetota bacterium]|nr:MAG: XdhC family protein [Planctomycetota bacterium]